MDNLRQFRNTSIYASTDGTIYRKLKSGKFKERKGVLRNVGYWFHHISLPDNKFINIYTHQIIAECFLGPRPNGYEVDHINNCKIDNRLSNLRYLTLRDNRRKGVQWREHLRSLTF